MEYFEYRGRSWSPDCSSSDRLGSETAARHGQEAREGNEDLRSSPSFGRGFEETQVTVRLATLFRCFVRARRQTGKDLLPGYGSVGENCN